MEDENSTESGTVRRSATKGKEKEHSPPQGSSSGRGGRAQTQGQGRQSSQRQTRDQPDYSKPEELRGIIQSLSEQMLEMNRQHQQSQDSMLALIQSMQAQHSPVPDQFRQSVTFNTHQDEAIPSVEELAQGRNTSVPLSMVSNGQPRLSKNVPEADALDNGIDPTFRQWRASIYDKLRENADHFTSERSRCTHVWLKTTGLARTYLTPRYTSVDRPFASVSEMLTCLESYFLSGTETEEARNRFNDMHMQDKGHVQESFPEFKARFLADAIEGNVPESEWFFALWNKLPVRIRLQNVAMKALWNENFSNMVQHLTRVEMERARPSNKPTMVATDRTKPTTTIKKSTYPVRTSSSTSANPVRSGSTFRPYSGLMNAEKRTPAPDQSRLKRSSATPAATAKCYRCGEYGHYKADCPNPPTVNEIDGDEALEQRREDMQDVDEDGVESDQIPEGNEEA